VLVHHSVDIDCPIETVASAFATGPHTWFPQLERSNRTALDPQFARVVIQKKVVVEVGVPSTSGAYTEFPITWQATYIKQPFPVMTGKIELAAVDARVTRLTVCGMYQAPLGRLGAHFDDALMHEVAEATVTELAEAIAKRFAANAGGSAWAD
jgi:hypothetical protein